MKYPVLIIIICAIIFFGTINLIIINTNPITEKWLSLFFFLEFLGIIIIGGILRDWYIRRNFTKSIEKKKKKFGEDYLEETIRRFEERYPDNKNSVPQDGISYFYARNFRKVEKEVLKERKHKYE
jgi:hypothetical protein